MRYMNMIVLLILLSTLWIVESKRTKTRTMTYVTKYTERKMKYCFFDGYKILPKSKFSTPTGCVKCKCTEKFLKCKLMAKTQKKRQRLGCY